METVIETGIEMGTDLGRRFRRFSVKGLVGLLSGIGLAGCASMNVTPGWVGGGVPAEFPKNAFVTALGTGDSLAAAQIAAKGELSRVFSARLNSELEWIERETVVGEAVVQSSDLFDSTKIETEIELEGVEVPLHWRDPRSGEIWALAILERSKECLRIRSEGRDLITQLDRLAGEARTNANVLVALRAAMIAVDLGTSLDGLQARSRVLGSQCLTPRSIATGRLKADAEAMLRRLSFVVKTEDVDPRSGRVMGSLPQLREQIAGNLTRMGFQVGPAAGASVVPIAARLRLHRVERGTDWVEFRWEGSAEIGSPIAGDPAIIAAESEGAESHPEPSTARLRARRTGELDLSRELDRRLKAFLAEGGEG
ncbi:MAG: hypothetical protein CL933_03065 [Deltaproteobacteria bacterium]|nr:hypothetical protein [Deltaproteobacteria bacterium]